MSDELRDGTESQSHSADWISKEDLVVNQRLGTSFSTSMRSSQPDTRLRKSEGTGTGESENAEAPLAQGFNPARSIRTSVASHVFVGQYKGTLVTIKLIPPAMRLSVIQNAAKIIALKQEHIRHTIGLWSPEAETSSHESAHQRSVCVVTDYFEGWPLSLKLQNPRVLQGWSARINIMLIVARALAYLHTQGLLYPALRLSRVWVSNAWETELEANVGAVQEGTHAEDIISFLSPEWAPPELAEGIYTKASDVYMLGLVVYGIITRKDVAKEPRSSTPVGNEESVFDDPLYTATIPKSTPEELIALLSACTCTNPHSRPSLPGIIAALELLKENQDAKENKKVNRLKRSGSESSLRLARAKTAETLSAKSKKKKKNKNGSKSKKPKEKKSGKGKAQEKENEKEKEKEGGDTSKLLQERRERLEQLEKSLKDRQDERKELVSTVLRQNDPTQRRRSTELGGSRRGGPPVKGIPAHLNIADVQKAVAEIEARGSLLPSKKAKDEEAEADEEDGGEGHEIHNSDGEADDVEASWIGAQLQRSRKVVMTNKSRNEFLYLEASMPSYIAWLNGCDVTIYLDVQNKSQRRVTKVNIYLSLRMTSLDKARRQLGIVKCLPVEYKFADFPIKMEEDFYESVVYTLPAAHTLPSLQNSRANYALVVEFSSSTLWHTYTTHLHLPLNNVTD